MCSVNFTFFLLDAAQSNALKTYNHLLEAVFHHAEKWEVSDIKETGILLRCYDTKLTTISLLLCR